MGWCWEWTRSTLDIMVNIWVSITSSGGYGW